MSPATAPPPTTKPMPATAEQARCEGVTLTAEDLAQMPDEQLFELQDGEPQEKPMSIESSAIAAKVVALLHQSLPADQWLITTADGGFACFGNPGLVKKPDAAATRRDRVALAPTGSYMTVPADLAVEVVSPTDVMRNVFEKCRLYQRAGFKLIWLVSPDDRSVHVMGHDVPDQWLHAGDTLEGGDVLPGVSLKIDDLFPGG